MNISRASELRFDGFHLPGVKVEHLDIDEREFADAEVRVLVRTPRASPALAEEVIARLREAQIELQQRPVQSVVEALASVGERLASGPHRQAALEIVPAVTGYSRQMVALSLDLLARLLRPDELSRMLARELGERAVLDGLRRRHRATGRSRAYGLPLVCHFFSGNVPGIPAFSLTCALLVKSASLGKVATEEPAFAALFARLLAEVDPLLGRAVAVLGWRGGDEEVERIILPAADAVIVYGSDDAIASVRRRTPARATFLAYGHKVSFAVIGREEIVNGRIRETARLAARDVSMFDQQACLSPHVLYIEGGTGSALAFARVLAEEMAAFEADVPRGRISPAEAAAIHQLRGAYEMRSFSDEGVDMIASPGGTAWTVLVDPDPRFESSCLNRCVRLKPVADIRDVRQHVAPIRPWLQTVGARVAPHRVAGLADGLGALGVTRLCPLGTMAIPSFEWHHDGRANLLDLVRWMDCEA